LPHFYFDPLKLHRFDPQFEWRGHAYFSSGAFACRRNAIPFEAWQKTDSWNRQSPGLFAWGEMGTLNYLVHAMAQRKEITTAMSNLQQIWGHHGKQELVQDCRGADWHFPKRINRPRIAHFCGHKPFLFDRKSYSRPFTIARMEHHRRRHTDTGAWLLLLIEDCELLASRIRRRLER
jgi:hypothetical protein